MSAVSAPIRTPVRRPSGEGLAPYAWVEGPLITLHVAYHGTLQDSPIRSSRDAASYVEPYLLQSDRELMLMVPLNTRHKPLGVHVVSIGSLSQSIVHPREVFKAAICVNAAAIILAHNHPGGDPEPSDEDKTLTQRLQSAGGILGIRLLDHLILVDSGRWFSFADQGLL
ncbi:MAG: DNA repair protein RadC [Nitrospirae bacterium]|nr:MAG: DNA repair protein RadC [Nitrospirota bacterium]